MHTTPFPVAPATVQSHAKSRVASPLQTSTAVQENACNCMIRKHLNSRVKSSYLPARAPRKLDGLRCSRDPSHAAASLRIAARGIRGGGAMSVFVAGGVRPRVSQARRRSLSYEEVKGLTTGDTEDHRGTARSVSLLPDPALAADQLQGSRRKASPWDWPTAYP